MAAKVSMVASAGMVVAAEATVEAAASTVLFSRPSALRCHLRPTPSAAILLS